VTVPTIEDVARRAGVSSSIATDEAGATVEVFRRSPALDGWPYYPEPADKTGAGTRVRLIPYHQWANRGPAAMRTWIPAG
jgi:DUF1680 family protein